MRVLAVLIIWLAASPLWAQEITEATYTDPTTRYPHGVLGDDEEWGGMMVKTRRKTSAEGSANPIWQVQEFGLTLPQEQVFEDLAPRLVDVDGDGAPEIIVVESHRDFGARLAIYDLNPKGVPYMRSWTRYIGQPNRWLAPVGVADFDGNGMMEIAFVDRPHLKRRLLMFPFAEGEIKGFAALDPVTNHRIGDDYISGGVRDCAGQPEMILLSPDWKRLVLVQWSDADGLVGQDFGPNNSPESIAAALRCE